MPSFCQTIDWPKPANYCCTDTAERNIERECGECRITVIKRAQDVKTGKRSSTPIRIPMEGRMLATPVSPSGPSATHSTSCRPHAECWYSSGYDRGLGGCRDGARALRGYPVLTLGDIEGFVWLTAPKCTGFLFGPSRLRSVSEQQLVRMFYDFLRFRTPDGSAPSRPRATLAISRAVFAS
jgi:hypothetical protein